MGEGRRHRNYDAGFKREAVRLVTEHGIAVSKVAEDHRGEFRVKKMCEVLTLSKSGYYAWRRHIPSKRQKDNELLLGHIQAVHRQSRGTYIPTDEGWLYLAGVMNVRYRKIIGLSMKERLTEDLIVEALKQAIVRDEPTHGLIHHSDRGSQYASREYHGLLQEHGILPSMSRKGNCYAHAYVESFFHTLKTELIYLIYGGQLFFFNNL